MILKKFDTAQTLALYWEWDFNKFKGGAINKKIIDRYTSKKFLTGLGKSCKDIYRKNCLTRIVPGGENSLTSIVIPVVTKDDFYFCKYAVEVPCAINLIIGINPDKGNNLKMPFQKNRGYIAKLSEKYDWYAKKSKYSSYKRETENPLFIRLYGTREYSERFTGVNISTPYVTNVKFGRRASRSRVQKFIDDFENKPVDDWGPMQEPSFLNADDIDSDIEDIMAEDINRGKLTDSALYETGVHVRKGSYSAVDPSFYDPKMWKERGFLQYSHGVEPRHWFWAGVGNYEGQWTYLPYQGDINDVHANILKKFKSFSTVR